MRLRKYRSRTYRKKSCYSSSQNIAKFIDKQKSSLRHVHLKTLAFHFVYLMVKTFFVISDILLQEMIFLKLFLLVNFQLHSFFFQFSLLKLDLHCYQFYDKKVRHLYYNLLSENIRYINFDATWIKNRLKRFFFFQNFMPYLQADVPTRPRKFSVLQLTVCIRLISFKRKCYLIFVALSCLLLALQDFTCASKQPKIFIHQTLKCTIYYMQCRRRFLLRCICLLSHLELV